MHFFSLRLFPKCQSQLSWMRSDVSGASPAGKNSYAIVRSTAIVDKLQSIKLHYHIKLSSTPSRKRRLMYKCTSDARHLDQPLMPSLLPAPKFSLSSTTRPFASSIAATAIITRHKSSKKESSSSSSSSSSSDASSMDDEYGAMNSAGKTYTYPSHYYLESFGTFGHWSGNTAAMTQQIPRGVLHPAYINYNTYGTLNNARDNVLVICHALTGNASLEAWWGELLGPGKAFDTDQYFIVCCNILGSCYGSVGPSSVRPGFDDGPIPVKDIPKGIPRNKSGQAIYGMDFPDVR